MRTSLVLAAGLLLVACRTPSPFIPLPGDDARGRMLLEHWTRTASERQGVSGHLVNMTCRAKLASTWAREWA